MKRELTKNEKILLILLGIVIVFWVAFKFIINPQTDKLQNLTEQKYEYEKKVSHMNTILRNGKNINNEWVRLNKEKDIIANKYFSNLDQSQIIYLLNEFLDSEELEILDINFSMPSEEQIGDLMVKNMDITIPYRGSYTGVCETVGGLVSSPKEILISDLIMDKDSDNKLAGSMSIKIYSLAGIAETEANLIHVDIESNNNDKSSPFKSFDDYKETDSENIILDDANLQDDFVSIIKESSNIDDYKDDYKKELLEDFEDENLYFIPSNKNIKGNLSQSIHSKSKKYSLRFEYNILAVEEKNRAYIDLTDRNIILKYPPSSIGLWVYSYSYSPITLGIELKGQAGEGLDVELAKGISWIGWEYVEVVPPQDLCLYPLQLDNIYLELAYNRDDYGVVLFDTLVANYPKDSNKTDKKFIFYIVEKGDTLDKISIKNYGTNKKKNSIIRYNEINSDKDIREGQILVIPK